MIDINISIFLGNQGVNGDDALNLNHSRVETNGMTKDVSTKTASKQPPNVNQLISQFICTIQMITRIQQNSEK